MKHVTSDGQGTVGGSELLNHLGAVHVKKKARWWGQEERTWQSK